MAIIITDECINCGACEPECPNNAIYEGGVEWTWGGGTSLTEIELEDGTIKQVIGKAGLDILNTFKKNPKEAKQRLQSEGTISEKYDFNNFDLITWLIIS